MSKLRIIAAAVGAGALVATAAFAVPPTLQQRVDNVASAKEQAAPPNPEVQKMQRNNQQVEGMIQQLESGNNVDPGQIQRLMRDAQQ
jgi:hypothetical protein